MEDVDRPSFNARFYLAAWLVEDIGGFGWMTRNLGLLQPEA